MKLIDADCFLYLNYLILSANARCLASFFLFLAHVNDIMRPLMYALAQSHSMRGDVSEEVLVSRYCLSSAVMKELNSLSLKGMH